MSSSSYIINTDLTVVGMGGFTGSNDAPSVSQLTTWQQSGQLGFVQLGGGPGGGPGGKGAPGQGKQPPGGSGGPGGTQTEQRQQWVRQACTPVAPEAYGGDGGADAASTSQELYDCRSGS